MKLVFIRPLLSCVLLTKVCIVFAAGVNPITVTFNNGNTNFPVGDDGTANFVVATNSSIPGTLKLGLTNANTSSGLTAIQVTAGDSPCSNVSTLCGSTFSLTPGGNCCLAFRLTAPLVGSYTMAPLVSTSPPTFSAKAATLDVTANDPPGDDTTISVTAPAPAKQIIPVQAQPGNVTFTVRNTGANAALNVHAELPSTWTGVTINNCGTIDVGNTCTLTLSSTAANIAANNILITGDNVTNDDAVIAVAFSINNYLVFAVDSTTSAKVIYSGRSNTALAWDTGPCTGRGCTITGASSLTNGNYLAPEGNTYYILNAINTAGAAANYCYNLTTGGVPNGTWYLPAICEMGSSGQAANCASGTSNIYTNLVVPGFGSFSTSYYWSSTEEAAFPNNFAWAQIFSTPSQSDVNKTSVIPYVWCVRSIPY